MTCRVDFPVIQPWPPLLGRRERSIAFGAEPSSPASLGRQERRSLGLLEGATAQAARAACLAWLIAGAAARVFINFGMAFFIFGALEGTKP
jgi:hypothetical protein